MEAFEQPVAGPQAPRRSTRKWLLFLIAGFVVLILFCAGLCGGIFVAVIGVLKHSTPYQMALERVQQDPQVIKRLGTPIEDDTWMPSGNVSTTNASGQATLDFDVAGPKGKAHVHTSARCVDNVWGLNLLEVTFKDGQRVSLDTSGEGGPEDAPRWPPAAKRQ